MSRPRLQRPRYRLTAIAGRRKWYIAWTEGGRTRLISTGVPVSAEIEWGEDGPQPGPEALSALATFAAAQDAPNDQPAIAELMDKRFAYWKGKTERKKPALSSMTSFHKLVKGFFGGLTVDQLTPARIAAYSEHRAANSGRPDGKPPVTAITRELEELRSALLYARDNGWISTVPKIAMPSPRPPREIFMSREQGQALIEATERLHLRLFVKLALATGRRAGAILDLTWDRIDFERGIVDFRNPELRETKKRRGVSSVDRQILAELQMAYEVAKTDNVIEFRGKKVESVKHAFAEAAIRAGLFKTRRATDAKGKAIDVKVPWVTPHVCKHSVISWLAEDGFSIEQIAEMTDTDEKTVKRVYRKVSTTYLSGMRDSLAKIVNVGPPVEVSANGVRKNARRKTKLSAWKDGASDGTRTHDPLDHNHLRVVPKC